MPSCQENGAREAMRVTPDDPWYQRCATAECEFWTSTSITTRFLNALLTDRVRALFNEQLTGFADQSWMDDLIGRGPFRRAAVLGCTEGLHESRWLAAGVSEELDVYELSRGVIEKTQRSLQKKGPADPSRGTRIRFVQADLNFVQLPRNTYDVVWSTMCVHHLVNLEYLLAEIASALRTGGLFAMMDYVGEARLRYAPDRLRCINRVLEAIPPPFRREGIQQLGCPKPEEISPFEALRSNETLGVARTRMRLVHLGRSAALFPLAYHLRLAALERRAPQLMDRLLEAERNTAARSPEYCCEAYAIFQKQ
jgi:SAM-dependent methyltransferase